MKKILSLALACILMLGLFAGCAGTTVVINECTCPEGHDTPDSTEPSKPAVTEPVITGEGAVKTGLSISTSVSDSTSATAEADGAVKYDITLAAVTVDDEGVITSCIIDSVPATVSMNAQGQITSDIAAAVSTKNELGENYGMVAWGGAVAEWDAQVAALCSFAVGKTVDELKNGAIDETGKAPQGSDLATTATIYLGGYVSAIEAAVANATHLGAQQGDELRMVTLNSLAGSDSTSEEGNGCAQLETNIAVVTVKDGVITSCIIDSVQADVAFDATGTITTDLTAPILSKNEKGADYGMVAWGGAIAEWNEQAAAFAAYVTGKTAEEVAGIAITETTKPADGTDLATSVTISIGGFQALIAKALA